MTSRICFFNQSPIHYRKAIYELMDKELEVDFYFGDNRNGGIKTYDTSSLLHNKKTLKNVNIGPFYWQKGALSLLKSDYTDIITPGDINCISTWLMLIAAKYYNKRIFTWTHGAYGKEGLIRRMAIRFRATRLAGILLYGNYAKEILVKYGIDENKMHVIYNSLAYDEQIALRSKITGSDVYKDHFMNGNKNIIFIGRLTKVKKLDQILEATSLLAKKGKDYNVTFIGNGSEKDYLTDLAKTLCITNVWFHGACYDEKVLSELIYNADLCVSPGNVGLTAMHSMVFGTPVISHNNYITQMPEFEAILPGKTGGFFNENNVESLANSIEQWFSKGLNREDVRKNCFEVIDKKYNPHVQIETIKKALGI